ncbi:MAG: tRNA (adenosine(37)-N6)-threonylcarbamoyltransferase complex dimerization subunit type 1 TsaB [Alphaproteobacteria bacterium]|nr:tRNA (adenosine(37)-N6)-threonylcarbamoyltransferase complex dimerization subunit type 1 TsaB [Alphaproteobacteria bacterium]
MRILAFDTALGGCAVACLHVNPNSPEPHQQAVRRVETARDQARILVPLIQDTLAELSWTLDELDLIVTTTGPGSFTGLRLGLSTARALSLALNKPVVGVETLSVLAHQVTGSDPVAVILETKRTDYYFQTFLPGGIPQSSPQSLSTEAIIDVLSANPYRVIGDALNRLEADMGKDKFQHICLQPLSVTLLDPYVLAYQGRSLFQKGIQNNTEPLYLRDADVSFSKKPVRYLARHE